jgi:hypothetical protein
VTDNGDGTWHYEYALYNESSHRSARSFGVPIPSGVNVTNLGFHDVDYHSGDGIGGSNFDGADWDGTLGGGELTWATETEAQNANGNALRWGTLYNFRFDADAPPTAENATIGLFRAGSPPALTVMTKGPLSSGHPCPWDCGDGDGAVGVVDFLALLTQWGGPGGCDFDGDDHVGVGDFLALIVNWGPCG